MINRKILIISDKSRYNVSKDNHKKIIIGKNGNMIKNIGTKARINN